MIRKLTLTFALLAAAILFGSHAGTTLAQKGNKGGGGYQVIALDSKPGGAYDIRVHATFAEVVGTLAASGELPQRARYWRLDSAGAVTKTIDLKTPSNAIGSSSSGINWDGIIVGGCFDNTTGLPLAWPSFADTPIELPVPEGADYAHAMHINDNWLVVGLVTWVGVTQSLVAWQLDLDDAGRLVCTDAIIIASGSFGRGGLNNQGYYATTHDNFAWCWRVVWNPLLGEFGGLEVVYGEQLLEEYSTATGINEAGTV